MTIDEIETFVSIARLGGFARAAEGLRRSQPAISRRVEMLEEHLGIPLFERVRSGRGPDRGRPHACCPTRRRRWRV